MSRVKKPLKIKIISVGNCETGKSCIIKRYCEKRFVNKYLQTIGIDYGVTKVSVRDRDIKLNIFDMSGHKLFHDVRNEFYRDTQGAILVFDVTEKSSFDALNSWIDEIKQDLEAVQSGQTMDNMVFAVCGNKIDKGKRVVDETDARMWAMLKGYHYFETSASSGAGIAEMFETLLSEIVNVFDNGGKPAVATAEVVGGSGGGGERSGSFNKEQLEAIHRLKNSKDNYERLGLKFGCSRDEINNSFRRLAKLLHPDKNVYPGSNEAFKLLLAAKNDLLNNTP